MVKHTLVIIPTLTRTPNSNDRLTDLAPPHEGRRATEWPNALACHRRLIERGKGQSARVEIYKYRSPLKEEEKKKKKQEQRRINEWIK